MASKDTGRTLGRRLGMLGVVLVFSGLFAALTITSSFKDPIAYVQLILGVVCIAVYLGTNVGTLGEKFSGRGTIFLATSVISGLFLIGALIGVNYVAVKKPKSWDLTKDQVFTLSDQTTSVLKGLKDEVHVIAFYGPAEPEYGELDGRMKQYKEQTDKLKVDILDPAKHLAEVKEYNISQTGPRVIVKQGGKEARAKELTEEALTNAIAEVGRGATKKIYFTKGHGERGLDDPSERGIKLFVDDLKSEGYQTDEILLAEHKELPADVAEIVVAGPQTSFSSGETKLLQDWTEKGGKLFVMIDPTIVSGLEGMLGTWGISIDNDEVLDPESQQPQIAIAQAYADHPITSPRSSARLSVSLFPLARSVSKKGNPAGWTLVELAQTGANAWGEVDAITGDTVPQYDEGKDIKGPVTLAIAATHGSGDAESRVVAVGNSSFLANGFYRLGSDRDLALNAAVWGAHEESKIAIHPKLRQSNHLFLSTEQKRTMTLFSFDLLPFALLFAGLLVWQTRKAR